MSALVKTSSLINRLVMKCYEHPRLTLVLLILVTCVAIGQLSRLQVDTSTANLIGTETPTATAYRQFTDLFGHDVVAIVTISAPEVLSPATLARIRDLHDEVHNKAPHTKRVLSLINAPQPRKTDQTITMSGALNPWPETEQEWQSRRQNILNYAPYQNILIDDQERFTLLIVQLATEIQQDGDTHPIGTEHYEELVKALKPVLANHESDDFQLELTGEAALDAAIQRTLLSDLLLLGTTSFLVGALVMWLLIRQLLAVVMPITAIALALIGCFALMAAWGHPIHMVTTLLPPLIVGLGVADAVHLLNAFYRHNVVTPDRRSAFSAALDETSSPMLMTTLTTTIGLLSFTLVDISALSSFGIFGGVATLLTYIFTLLIGALVIRYAPHLPPRHSGKATILAATPFLRKINQTAIRFASRHSTGIVAGALLVIFTGIFALKHLELSHDSLHWVPQHWTEVQGINQIESALGASTSFELMIDSGRRHGALDPMFIAGLRELQEKLMSTDQASMIAATRSVDSYLQEISLAMDDRVLVYHQYQNADSLLWRDMRLFQLSLPDEFRTLVSRDLRFVRVTLSVPRGAAMEYSTLMSTIDNAVEEMDFFSDMAVTGFIPILRETLEIIIEGASRSFLFAALIITLMMAILFSNLKLGLASMLPNFFPIAVVMSALIFSGISLDMLTIMIGSLTLGVVVDDTIHFVNNFNRALASGKTAESACLAALNRSGRAMLITSIVLISAFSVMNLSQLENLNLFALMSAGIIGLGVIADFIILPAVLILIHRNSQGSPEQ